jgi:hypoxanthine phosphoribosyltransferase
MSDANVQWISIQCLNHRHKRLLYMYIKLLQRRGFLSILAGALAIYSILWMFWESAGFVGSLPLFFFLITVSVLFVLISTMLRFMRWPVLDWTIDKCLMHIREYDPKIIIGVGRGGAHIAAMLCHKLSGKNEPVFLSLDRLYFKNKFEIYTTVGDFSELRYESIKSKGKILLATAEVHTGDTLGEARRLLEMQNIDHQAFAVLKSPSCKILVEYYALEIDSRDLIPWPTSRIKQQNQVNTL